MEEWMIDQLFHACLPPRKGRVKKEKDITIKRY